MRQTDTKTLTQVHRAEVTIQFLVILLWYIQILHKIHESIQAKKSMWQKHSHVCFHVNTFSYFSHSIYNSKHFKV